MGVITGPFNQVLTMSGLPLKGPLQSGDLEVLEDVWVGCSDGNITGIGSLQDLRDIYPDAQIQELSSPAVLLPGIIDSHTHICWAGNRANDYAMRLEGKSYLEIAASGGGIWSSVEQCRQADKAELVQGILDRSHHLLTSGVTTIEVKSGYGLAIEAEIKILEAIREANHQSDAQLIPTCLAAHMTPKDFNGGSSEYLDHLLEHLLPKIKAKNLTNRIDIFVESSAFDVGEALNYLNKAKEAGFQLTVHGDQFTTGGSQVAIDAGALSVDHLEASTDSEIQALASSNVVATVLPSASIGLGMEFAAARKLLDAGCCLAIASDWNPGSAPMGEFLIAASILGVYEKLSIAEVLAGITVRAAAALDLKDRGTLAKGKKADMQAYPVSDYREIIYNQGRIRPKYVWVNGIIVTTNW